MSVNPDPVWGRKSIFRFKDDKIFYIWTGESKIEIYDLQGVSINTLDLELEHLEITEKDKTEALNFEAMMMDKRKSHIRESLREAMPKDFWPWIHDFLIDDVGRFWIGLPSHFGDNDRVWQVYDVEGNYIRQHKLPADFTVHKIVDNLVFGEFFNFDKFTSTVRIYKVIE